MVLVYGQGVNSTWKTMPFSISGLPFSIPTMWGPQTIAKSVSLITIGFMMLITSYNYSFHGLGLSFMILTTIVFMGLMVFFTPTNITFLGHHIPKKRASKRSAKLFTDVKVSGWFFPSSASRPSRARANNGAASLSLPWTWRTPGVEVSTTAPSCWLNLHSVNLYKQLWKISIFLWVNQRTKWPCSVAMLV